MDSVAVHYINGEEIEKYFYDDKGRIIESKNALGESTKLDYSKEGNTESVIITLHDSSKRKVYYDNRGNISGIEEENGKVTTYEYDNLNRVYDERNRLISYRDKSGEETEYEYGKHSLIKDMKYSHMIKI